MLSETFGQAQTAQLLRPLVASQAREDQRCDAVLVRVRDVRTLVEEQLRRRLVAYWRVLNFSTLVRIQSCQFTAHLCS